MTRNKALILAVLRIIEEAEGPVALPPASPALDHCVKLLVENKFIKGASYPDTVELNALTWAGYDLLDELSAIPGVVAAANDLKGKVK